jgi:hypothetical protein
MIYTSAALAYLHENPCDMPDIAQVRGDVAWLKAGEGWAEVWRDTELAYRDTARDYGTAEGICAAIAELGPGLRGTAAHLLAGDILKDEPIPEDLPAVAGTETAEGLAARVWLYWAENDGCDGRDVCEGVGVLR